MATLADEAAGAQAAAKESEELTERAEGKLKRAENELREAKVGELIQYDIKYYYTLNLPKL
jgi:hypothetical protein